MAGKPEYYFFTLARPLTVECRQTPGQDLWWKTKNLACRQVHGGANISEPEVALAKRELGILSLQYRDFLIDIDLRQRYRLFKSFHFNDVNEASVVHPQKEADRASADKIPYRPWSWRDRACIN